MGKQCQTLFLGGSQITADGDCSHEIKTQGGGSGWGTRVYLWRIHVDVWQNQYNIVKLKNKIYKL